MLLLPYAAARCRLSGGLGKRADSQKAGSVFLFLSFPKYLSPLFLLIHFLSPVFTLTCLLQTEGRGGGGEITLGFSARVLAISKPSPATSRSPPNPNARSDERRGRNAATNAENGNRFDDGRGKRTQAKQRPSATPEPCRAFASSWNQRHRQTPATACSSHLQRYSDSFIFL